MGSICKVYALIERAGLEFDLDDFDHRIVVQKLICLLELKGIELGYSFSLYLRGPYSPDLTKDLYDCRTIPDNLPSLPDIEKEALDDLIERIGVSSVDLEISATYGFLRSTMGLGAPEAISRTRSIKPYFSNSKVSLVVSRTNGYLFEPSRKEVLDMKRDAGSWEEASLEDSQGWDR